MWNLKKNTPKQGIQQKNRPTDTENRLVVTSGVGKGQYRVGKIGLR